MSREWVPEWMDDAACHDVHPDLFFPERGDSTREAKETCASCPVRVECLEYALDLGITHGIWGGKSERERRSLRRGRGRRRAS
jgi:WhiB family redox-sensing transcriptional regulator